MLNQNPRQADFVLGNCPYCQKVVRIPVTAVTSQSKSQVRCPICDAEFEIAEVLEDTIPEVEVIDDDHVRNVGPSQPDPNRERINAIDTPELFHISKDDYQPKTEKKNGRFVVPKLLSKGIKKKRKRSRRQSRRSPNDPKLQESLAKLKQNTSTTSLQETKSPEDESQNDDSRSERLRNKSTKRRKKRDESRKPVPTSSTVTKREVTFGNWLRSMRSRIKRYWQNVRTFGFGDPGPKSQVIMIAIGALMAIPMLHVIMWWFVGVDPFGLAKPAGKIAPFMVPHQLRVEEEPAQAESQNSVVNEQEVAPTRHQPETITRDKDGKLPKPKLDPSSVHTDDY